MALSNSERQEKYRTRRLGPGGTYERINCLVGISTKRNVERLAFHLECTITELLEQLINEKTHEVLSKLDGENRDRFFLQDFSTGEA